MVRQWQEMFFDGRYSAIELMNPDFVEVAAAMRRPDSEEGHTVARIRVGDAEESVVTRDEWPLERALESLNDETIAVLGYGVQGEGETLLTGERGASVQSGHEAKVVIEECGKADYRERLDAELGEMADQEIWRAGQTAA